MADPAGTGHAAGFYRRDEQSVWYDSPNWNGFTFGVAIGTPVRQDRQHQSSAVGSRARSTLPRRFRWRCGLPTPSTTTTTAWEPLPPILPPASAVRNPGTSSKDKAYQLGVSYTLGDIMLFGLYEELKYTTDGQTLATAVDEYKRGAWNLGMKWNLATGYVGAQYIQAMSASCTTVAAGCNADNTGAKTVGVGVLPHADQAEPGLHCWPVAEERRQCELHHRGYRWRRERWFDHQQHRYRSQAHVLSHRKRFYRSMNGRLRAPVFFKRLRSKTLAVQRHLTTKAPRHQEK